MYVRSPAAHTERRLATGRLHVDPYELSRRVSIVGPINGSVSWRHHSDDESDDEEVGRFDGYLAWRAPTQLRNHHLTSTTRIVVSSAA